MHEFIQPKIQSASTSPVGKEKQKKGHIMNSEILRLIAGCTTRTEHTTLVGIRIKSNSEEFIYNPGFAPKISEISPIIHKTMSIFEDKPFGTFHFFARRGKISCENILNFIESGHKRNSRFNIKLGGIRLLCIFGLLTLRFSEICNEKYLLILRELSRSNFFRGRFPTSKSKNLLIVEFFTRSHMLVTNVAKILPPL